MLFIFSILLTSCELFEPEVVEDPKFSHPSNTYGSAITVTISCKTGGAKIRFTTDGSVPTSACSLYTGGVTISSTTTLRAKAFKAGSTASKVVTANYVIQSDAINATLLTLPVNNAYYEIESEGDVDWYRFNVSTTGQLVIFTTRPSGTLDPAAWLYGPHSSNGTTVNPSSYISHNDDGNGNLQPRIVYNVTSTGYYFLRIAHFASSPTILNKQELPEYPSNPDKSHFRSATGPYYLNIIR